MENYHLDLIKEKLRGPTIEQIITCNQWAATAFDKYYTNSKTVIQFSIDGTLTMANLEWNSDFSKTAMKEDKDIAHHGGVAMAWFVMSVLLNHSSVEQSEIGDGVDYRFQKEPTHEDDLNFLGNYHYVEISGILQESKTNTLKRRIKEKHDQIQRGGKSDKASSVIVTLFSEPSTIKEIHK
jgi:hypothetical protein